MYQWQWEKCLPGQRNNSLQLLFGAKENLLLIVKGSQTWREIITSSAAGWERAQTRVSSLGISEWCLCVGKELPVGGDQTHLIPREKNSKKKKQPQHVSWNRRVHGTRQMEVVRKVTPMHDSCILLWSPPATGTSAEPLGEGAGIFFPKESLISTQGSPMETACLPAEHPAAVCSAGREPDEVLLLSILKRITAVIN